jgi:hypothetical protein
MSADVTIRSMLGRSASVALPAVLIVYAGALLQGMTLVSFPAVSAMLKQSFALSDADYGAIFLPQLAPAIVGAVAGGALPRAIGLQPAPSAKVRFLALLARSLGRSRRATQGRNLKFKLP